MGFEFGLAKIQGTSSGYLQCCSILFTGIYTKLYYLQGYMQNGEVLVSLSRAGEPGRDDGGPGYRSYLFFLLWCVS